MFSSFDNTTLMNGPAKEEQEGINGFVSTERKSRKQAFGTNKIRPPTR